MLLLTWHWSWFCSDPLGRYGYIRQCKSDSTEKPSSCKMLTWQHLQAQTNNDLQTTTKNTFLSCNKFLNSRPLKITFCLAAGSTEWLWVGLQKANPAAEERMIAQLCSEQPEGTRRHHPSQSQGLARDWLLSRELQHHWQASCRRAVSPGLPQRQCRTPLSPAEASSAWEIHAWSQAKHPSNTPHADCLWKSTTHRKQICTSVWKNLWVEFGLVHSIWKMETCNRILMVIIKVLHLYRSFNLYMTNYFRKQAEHWWQFCVTVNNWKLAQKLM